MCLPKNVEAEAGGKFDEPPPSAEYQTLAAFLHHLGRFLQFSEQAEQTAGVTTRQYQALPAIKGFPNRDRITIG